MGEEWALEFSDAHGITGSLRLTLPGGAAPATFDARVSIPGEGVVVVHDDDVPPPRSRSLLVVRAEGLWAELLCETPGEHWSFGLEAFGLRFASDEEAATSDVGDRLAVGLDLEWETPGIVHGELLVERDRIPFDGTGTFTETPTSDERS